MTAIAHLSSPFAHAIALFPCPGGFNLVVGNIAADMLQGSAHCLEEDLREVFPAGVESVTTREGSVLGRFDICACLRGVGQEAVMRFIREDLGGSENQRPY